MAVRAGGSARNRKTAGPGYKTGVRTTLACFALAMATSHAAAQTPIALHPENPHYFLWRGKPTVLISSGEHYGALINLDFDYRRYLDTLAKDGLTLTRLFSGSYVEPEGAFKIARNTLAPLPGRFISPWARSTEPGYANGGARFDLERWDDSYFARLKDLVDYANRKHIVVELTLFCPMYEEAQWQLSPMNAANNVNGIGSVKRDEVYTLDKDRGLLGAQEALTRKLVTTLNGMDNVMYELVNEPYIKDVPMDWQRHIADVIVEAERALPKKHLITQNVANKTATITAPHPAVSVFNFHYAAPPDAVGTNYHLNKVTGDNETGFRGTSDEPYRLEAWDFVIAGGGLFNNLDYSFAAGYEDGTFAYPATQPGGGNAGFRRQMRILKDFIHGFNFVRMRPDNTVFRGITPAAVTARALVEPEKAMAIFIRRDNPKAASGAAPPAAAATDRGSASKAPAVVSLDLPAGQWTATWIDTKTGRTLRTAKVNGGGIRPLDAPDFDTDIALSLRRR